MGKLTFVCQMLLFIKIQHRRDPVHSLFNDDAVSLIASRMKDIPFLFLPRMSEKNRLTGAKQVPKKRDLQLVMTAKKNTEIL